jgi:hypothetical protein
MYADVELPMNIKNAIAHISTIALLRDYRFLLVNLTN